MNAIKFASALFFAFIAFGTINAQNTNVSESGNAMGNTPRDGFYTRYMNEEALPLKYDYIHEGDVMWEKRVWREIDTRTLRNKHFAYEKQPLIEVLLDAIQNGDAQAYSTFDDEFRTPLDEAEKTSLSGTFDTIEVFDPETFEVSQTVVFNELDYADVKKFRVKEAWFFNNKTSRMEVRILGIAPIKDVYDDNGSFLFATPMFWAYYPEMRSTLAKSESFNPHNDAARLTWDDIFETRLFESTITKASNNSDMALKHIHGRADDPQSDLAILLEAEKIHNEIFHFESDVWSY